MGVDEQSMPASNRGRQAGFQMSEAHRTKIRNSRILGNLIKHAEGKREMTSSQVRAALGLLKKVLPDLSSTTLETEHGEPLIVHFNTVYEAPPADCKEVIDVRQEPPALGHHRT
jgi:hypothetical protein